METIIGKMLKNNGEFVKINQHNIHICRQGNENIPKIVFMTGSGTVHLCTILKSYTRNWYLILGLL